MEPSQKPHPGLPEGDLAISGAVQIGSFEHTWIIDDFHEEASLVAFRTRVDPDPPDNYGLGIFDLKTREHVLYPIGSFVDSIAFSPDGRHLLFRTKGALNTLEVATGAITRLATVSRAYDWYAFWLPDGRIVYPNVRRRLVAQRLGSGAVPIGWRIPNPPGGDDLLGSFAPSPDGKKLLLRKNCGTFLIDLARGKKHLLGRNFWVPYRAWAPNGANFVLQRGIWGPLKPPCERWDRLHPHDILFTRSGEKGGDVFGDVSSHGHELSWSEDGLHLFVSFNPTGNATWASTSLHVVELATGSRSTLVSNGFLNHAFMSSTGKVIFAVYHYAGPDYREDGGLWLADVSD